MCSAPVVPRAVARVSSRLVRTRSTAGPTRGSELRVDYVEALGRETFVGVTVADDTHFVHVPGRAALQPGSTLRSG